MAKGRRRAPHRPSIKHYHHNRTVNVSALDLAIEFANGNLSFGESAIAARRDAIRSGNDNEETRPLSVAISAMAEARSLLAVADLLTATLSTQASAAGLRVE